MITFESIIAEKGWDKNNLTPAQARFIAVKLRTPLQLANDGAKAVTSVVLTTLGVRNVTDDKAAENEKICRSNVCGKFVLTKGGSPLCTNCQCNGVFLRSKWKDSKYKCPRTPSLWDNTNA